MVIADIVRPAGTQRRHRIIELRVAGLVLCAASLLGVVVISVAVGAKPIPLGDVVQALVPGSGAGERAVIAELRLPRTVLGVAVGSALAVAGVLMQALTRNPLADPGILGINMGASAAVVAAVWLWHFTSLESYVWFAFVGAGLVSVLVYLLGSRGRSGATPVRLALAGTAVSAVLGSAVSAVTLLNPGVFDEFRFWGVGSLSGVQMPTVSQVLPFLAAGLALALGLSGALNALGLGDESAVALGSNVARTRRLGAVAITLLCGAATAVAGPIGFIGLVIPHAVRAVAGTDHRWVLPYALLLGPVLLLAADVVGRIITGQGEVQVGIVTAFVGAPVFIFLTRRRRIPEL
ncbi:FecCD family ABC transporter permease [Paenarthrobacter sp. NPDC090522]|uniref:FecCD family ABC transporter permease n=1 Tax=Paenarthrobacter sp. NPDC090522 TaxID=3364383 RepID=UPI00381F6C61